MTRAPRVPERVMHLAVRDYGCVYLVPACRPNDERFGWAAELTTRVRDVTCRRCQTTLVHQNQSRTAPQKPQP